MRWGTFTKWSDLKTGVIRCYSGVFGSCVLDCLQTFQLRRVDFVGKEVSRHLSAADWALRHLGGSRLLISLKRESNRRARLHKRIQCKPMCYVVYYATAWALPFGRQDFYAQFWSKIGIGKWRRDERKESQYNWNKNWTVCIFNWIHSRNNCISENNTSSTKLTLSLLFTNNNNIISLKCVKKSNKDNTPLCLSFMSTIESHSLIFATI